MRVIKTGAWLAAFAAVVVVAWPVFAGDQPASGPAVGSEAPLLHIDAFNDNKGAYCATCVAGQRPLIVVFATKDNEATRKLIAAVAEQQQKHDNLLALVALVQGHGDAGLKQYIEDKGLKGPAAVVPASNADYPKWKVNTDLESTLVTVGGHKIKAVARDATPDQLAELVSKLLG